MLVYNSVKRELEKQTRLTGFRNVLASTRCMFVASSLRACLLVNLNRVCFSKNPPLIPHARSPGVSTEGLP